MIYHINKLHAAMTIRTVVAAVVACQHRLNNGVLLEAQSSDCTHRRTGNRGTVNQQVNVFWGIGEQLFHVGRMQGQTYQCRRSILRNKCSIMYLGMKTFHPPLVDDNEKKLGGKSLQCWKIRPAGIPIKEIQQEQCCGAGSESFGFCYT
jgi:hypothetical protein